MYSKTYQTKSLNFIDVVNPVDPNIETVEIACDRILEAAQFIPIVQLGTTGDYGLSPFVDDTPTPREVYYEKIKARIEGTKLPEQILNKQK